MRTRRLSKTNENPAFNRFMGIRFPAVTEENPYYQTWFERYEIGLHEMWNRGDFSTRRAMQSVWRIAVPEDINAFWPK